jgi:hypothetical protein
LFNISNFVGKSGEMEDRSLPYYRMQNTMRGTGRKKRQDIFIGYKSRRQVSPTDTNIEYRLVNV